MHPPATLFCYPHAHWFYLETFTAMKSPSYVVAVASVLLLVLATVHALNTGQHHSNHDVHRRPYDEHASWASHENNEAVTVETESQETKRGADTLQIAGSRLPDCLHACGSCSPCRLVMVHFGCTSLDSAESETCALIKAQVPHEGKTKIDYEIKVEGLSFSTEDSGRRSCGRQRWMIGAVKMRRKAVVGGSNSGGRSLKRSMQRHEFCSGMKVLPLGCYDMVFGVERMIENNPVSFDYHKQKITVMKEGKKVTLKRSQDHTVQLYSAHAMPSK
ncbi:hypothetical protein RJ639_031812 [Escallonia herrerae]|uniref:Epidermal patterning factor-like protein n=1 Tax=Escallonia herrerae TaxID=1293975 RepID=A0AA89BNF5_9ASTE|nr:hypothetical protein RJ639_031812 [Escallonia herrerae]